MIRGPARLVALSALMLFVELVLIRWPAERNIYLRYFTNLVLLASFLGVGIGFIRGRGRRDGFAVAPAALALLAVFVVLFPVQQGRGADAPVLTGLAGTPALPIWLSLPLLFAGVAVAMALIAEGVARTFAGFEALRAYRLDILGSLAGIVAFSLLALVGARPIVWVVIACSGFAVLERPFRPQQL
ncbi:MAG TPA: spermidine synthase, partial [Actinomycetota bacterium]|nr:spermidine synthase [Actinomycetota bacterium]